MRHDCDVAIVGASFAGLAVAQQLPDARVLLIDRREVGSHQTSGCATPLSVAEAVGARDAVVQVFTKVVCHASRLSCSYPLPVPWCTFDYRAFCHAMLARTRAEVVQAVATGREGDAVRTSRDEVRARLIVDASGWRAALTRDAAPDPFAQPFLGMGAEERVQIESDALHFYVDASVVEHGYAWAFPTGETALVGLGTFKGPGTMRGKLAPFVDHVGRGTGDRHGGFMGCGLRRAVSLDTFIVGDAAGQCLPLTAEGIRPAVYFGHVLGALLASVRSGSLSLDAAKSRYEGVVRERAHAYRQLLLAQRAYARILPRGISAVLWATRWRWLSSRLLRRYCGGFHPMGLTQSHPAASLPSGYSGGMSLGGALR